MKSENSKKRYAFIDVQNTTSTTRKLLGFLIDWFKLYSYLTNKWKCEKVFFYSGIDYGDIETVEEFQKLAKIGYLIKTRTVFSYKKPDKIISIKCISCGKENIETVGMGYNHKSNCDVDLTVDVMEHASEDKEFLIFTGDGDFDYLIKKVVEKGTKVYIISTNTGINKKGLNTKRLSTRLKEVIKQFDQGRIDLINIDSWKMKIQKEL
jgi:uncharacterized LabA/DUF88 family protein